MARHPYEYATPLPTEQAPADHTPNYDDGSVMEQLRDALALLNTRLRPLTGHLNAHIVAGDLVSFASYTLTAGADAIQIVGNLPHGTLYKVIVNANASCHLTTIPYSTTLSTAFRVPANQIVELPVASDLWLFTDTGTPFVSVAVISFDLPS